MSRTLRDYQQQAIDAILRDLETQASTVLVLPTGTGKTIVMAKLAAGWQKGNTLLLAHRVELLDQAADKLGAELGYRPPVEQAERGVDPHCLFQGGMVVVGSVQTLCNEKRLDKFREHPFGLILIDECFPAGTLVDGKPIESIRRGDLVTAFDPATGKTQPRRVVRTFRQPAPAVMVTILAAGRRVTATPNHPFFTQRGWISARDVQVGDNVFGLFEDVHGPARPPAREVQARSSKTVLLPAMPCDLEEIADPCNVLCVQECVLGHNQGSSQPSQNGKTGLLLGDLRENLLRQPLLGHNVGHEPTTGIGQDEGAKPHAIRSHTREGVADHAGDGTSTNHPRRERPRSYGSGANAGRSDRARPADRADREPSSWLSDSLQDRSGAQDDETSRGDRWRQSQHTQGQGGGLQEGRLLAVSRVDRVEVHEQGGPGQPSRLCPDGYVYNLEVAGEHTYLANGFAVHNCHHATSASYRRIIDNFRAINPGVKVVGVTATPRRADNIALGSVFSSAAFQLPILDAIESGWLTPILQEFVIVEGVDFAGLRTSKNDFGEGDFRQEDLEAVLIEEEPLHAMAVPIIEKAANRQALVFCAGVQHAHLLAGIFNRKRMGSAVAIDGTTPKERRRESVADFLAGKIQFLTNFGVYVEGFDAPNTSLIVMGRPTKSLGLYCQMLGRGLRPLNDCVDGYADPADRRMAILTSDKPHCLVLDFVGVSEEHKLVSAADVLGGEFDPVVRERVKAACRKGGNVGDTMKRAQAEFLLEREQHARRAIRAKVQYQTYEVDPFGLPAPGSQRQVEQSRGGSSDGQIGFLVNLGVAYETAAAYSRRQASVVIDDLSRKRCTVKQAATLRKYGYDPARFNVETAGQALDQIAANGWRRPEEDVV